MLNIMDQTMLEGFEKAELEDPSPRKVIDSTRSIYKSRTFDQPQNGEWGAPILCDFGEARVGKVQQTGPFVQPHIYRAPEVVFEMPWDSPVDIWNVAALVRIRFHPLSKIVGLLIYIRYGTSLRRDICSIDSWTNRGITIRLNIWPRYLRCWDLPQRNS